MPLPANAATLVDLLVLIVVGVYVLEDVRFGFLHGLVELAGLLVALLAALLLYPAASGWLVEQFGLGYGLAKPLGFGLVWTVTGFVYGLTVRRVAASSVRDIGGSTAGRALGLVTGLMRGVLVGMLTLSIVSALPLPDPITDAVRDSQLGSRLAARAENVQRALGGVVGDAVQESIAILTVRPESSERVSLSFKVAEPRIDPDAEAQMLALLNRARAENGLEPVVLDPTIREVARGYSVTMFQQGYFAHVGTDGSSPFDRMRAGGVSFRAAGENLALAPTVQVAHDGLMNSPGHRANILNGRYKRIGIGVADGGMHGKMFTQNFAD
ncbi:MAG: CvpA family protein [Chloroflexi bacterium]|nr:CvpA family protein [Chloroflexota bacterium]